MITLDKKMEITFLGVGEACDPAQPNTSLLINTIAAGENRQILLDCGFTVPHLYFARCTEPEQLDALWISHFHGDHFLGVPLLQLRFAIMGRRKPLLILGQPGIRQKLSRALELAYPGFAARLTYPLKFIEMEPGRPLGLLGLHWQAAANEHSQPSWAIRIDNGAKSVFYSGDGRATKETTALARGCELAVHEAFHLDEESGGHGSIRSCLDFAGQARVVRLALVHLEHRTRKRRQEIEELLKQAEGFRVLLPDSGEELEI
jgi:ribonuclease Z